MVCKIHTTSYNKYLQYTHKHIYTIYIYFSLQCGTYMPDSYAYTYLDLRTDKIITKRHYKEH